MFLCQNYIAYNDNSARRTNESVCFLETTSLNGLMHVRRAKKNISFVLSCAQEPMDWDGVVQGLH